MDPSLERILLGVAHALFGNRLHLLRLTEIVRLGIKPDNEDGNMPLPAELDSELREQAINYVLTFLPEEIHPAIDQVKAEWLSPS